MLGSAYAKVDAMKRRELGGFYPISAKRGLATAEEAIQLECKRAVLTGSGGLTPPRGKRIKSRIADNTE